MKNLLFVAFSLAVTFSSLLFSCQNEDEIWNDADKSGNKKHLIKYINKFPNGKHKAEAETQVYEINKNEAWQNACKSESIISYYNYVSKFCNNNLFGAKDLDNKEIKIITEFLAKKISEDDINSLLRFDSLYSITKLKFSPSDLNNIAYFSVKTAKDVSQIKRSITFVSLAIDSLRLEQKNVRFLGPLKDPRNPDNLYYDFYFRKICWRSNCNFYFQSYGSDIRPKAKPHGNYYLLENSILDNVVPSEFLDILGKNRKAIEGLLNE